LIIYTIVKLILVLFMTERMVPGLGFIVVRHNFPLPWYLVKSGVGMYVLTQFQNGLKQIFHTSFLKMVGETRITIFVTKIEKARMV
jgi:hypothetical protein